MRICHIVMYYITHYLHILCTDAKAAKTHRMPYVYRSFSAKEPYNWWLFGEK